MVFLNRLQARLLVLYTAFAALAAAAAVTAVTPAAAAAAAASASAKPLRVDLSSAVRALLQAADGGGAAAAAVPNATAPNATAAAVPPPSQPAITPGPFVLEPLPYPYDALEPVISAQIMQLHHDAHEAAYVNKSNAAIASLLQQQQQPQQQQQQPQQPQSMAVASVQDGASTDGSDGGDGTVTQARPFAAFLVTPGSSVAAVAPRLAAGQVANMTLTQLLMQVGLGTLDPTFEESIRNNGGGHWNHQLFWKVMAPPGSANTSRSNISPQLQQAIDSAFGSVDAMLAELKSSGDDRFGSGWGWLCVAAGGGTGELRVLSTANQDNPIMPVVMPEPCTPILGVDVWEHAYYLQYEPRRSDYTAAWLGLINWAQVSANYDAARRGELSSIGAAQ